MLSFSPIQVVLIREQFCALRRIGGDDGSLDPDSVAPSAGDADAGPEGPEGASATVTR